MAPIHLTPDAIVYVEWGSLHLNATVLFTWIVMALLVGAARLVTARLSANDTPSRWQSLLEVLVIGMREQIRGGSRHDPGRYLPFIGTLFLFIAASNSLAIVPGFRSPTGSLSTTTALALCVLIAVPIYGIVEHGVVGYLRTYLQPSWLMLPFNVVGELTRTIALAIRLYGNVMSGTLLAGLLVSIVPFFFPTLMQLLGLLTGLIQAYIFAVLAMVYIAAASAAPEDARGRSDDANASVDTTADAS
jgi:F-type H+-transporting ATPase subunit a